MYLPPDFDLKIAQEAAVLIKQAYEQYGFWRTQQPWLINGNYDTPVVLSAKPLGILHGALEHVEHFGFVTRNKDTGTVFVVFRGTESPGDWMSNERRYQNVIAGGVRRNILHGIVLRRGNDWVLVVQSP